jgi:hypothetical protein
MDRTALGTGGISHSNPERICQFARISAGFAVQCKLIETCLRSPSKLKGEEMQRANAASKLHLVNSIYR